jgi:hypothetical protein
MLNQREGAGFVPAVPREAFATLFSNDGIAA